LDDLAGFAPQVATEQDRVIIRIDLTAGGGEVLEFDKSIQPNPHGGEVIDATPQARPPIIDQQEAIPPVKRGRGRPRGSKNKPKQPELPMLKKENESWKT
jgi:hypothetical protein